MTQYTAKQQRQQEGAAAAAAGYSQLPGPQPQPAAMSVGGPKRQHYYPAVPRPLNPSPSGPCSSTAPLPLHSHYPPQQYAAVLHAHPLANAPGVAVTGYPAASNVHNMQPISVAAVPLPQGSQALAVKQEPNACECCSTGWVLFGIGWLFPLCWFVGAFLPCCSKSRHDRRAAIASGVMAAVTIVVVVLAVAIPFTIDA